MRTMGASMSIRVLLTQGDERLVELAAEGHERAFEALVHRYRRPLLAYCRRLLLSGDRAEDALQQALLRAWLVLQDGCMVREPRRWLFRIVHNTALNALRVSGYDYATLSETLRGDDAPEHDLDRRIAVREAFVGLAALPPMQREALLQTAVHGQSHEQAARALGVSEGALRGLVYRARAAVRTATAVLTPSPLLTWALGSRGAGVLPIAGRIADIGAGGGSVGLGAALVKGGTIVVAAGALAGSLAAVHQRPHRPPTRIHSHPQLASATSRPSIAAGRDAADPGYLRTLGGWTSSRFASQARYRMGATSSQPAHTRLSSALRPGPTHPRTYARHGSTPAGPPGTSRPDGHPGAGPSGPLRGAGAGAPSGAPPGTLIAAGTGAERGESQGPAAETEGSKLLYSSPESHSQDGSGGSDGSDSSSSQQSGTTVDSGGDGSSAPSSPSAEGSGSWSSCGDCGQSGGSGDSGSRSGTSSGTSSPSRDASTTGRSG
jgi:RNA polymerase sigma factor (sigma-70 family)